MIEYVAGRVVRAEGDTITVEVGGIGYLIYCANPFVFQLNEENTVYTYQYVREDILRLYGFKSRKERELFERLLQVSGIGPKGALAILAAGAPLQVVEAVENENEAFLVKFPGVGKKTARQMILDLKGKLQDIIGEEGFLAAPSASGPLFDQPLEEALEALRALGYGEKEIQKVKPKLAKEQMSADEYVRKALQWMLS